MREEAETKIGEKFPEFTLVGFSTQVVAGTNYFLKVRPSTVYGFMNHRPIMALV